jgi:tRNA (guanine26-N2/guanine27-N2)-dimethyltransferase
MDFRFPVEKTTEGAASLLVPKLDRLEGEPLDHARSRTAVFYNPLMRLNRDSAVLAVAVLNEVLGRPVEACEPMCGSGVRGIRLSLEIGVGKVVMGDLNPSGVQLAEENIRRNNVSEYVRVREMDANLMLNLHSNPMNRFDYVDIDPYGSPSQFLDSAVRSTRDGGIIALTATDMAPLCGVNPLACLRKYGGRPLRTAYTHEVAVRLLLGAAVKTAAIHEIGATPVFSYFIDHYIRAYLKVRHNAKPADVALANMGYIVHCPKCLHRAAVKGAYLKTSRICPKCSGQLTVGGPMWLGDLAEEAFTSGMIRNAAKRGMVWDPRLTRLIESVKEEIGLPPTFYHLDELSSRLRKSSIKMEEILVNLKKVGYTTSRTHFDARGIKTNASITDLVKIIKG